MQVLFVPCLMEQGKAGLVEIQFCIFGLLKQGLKDFCVGEICRSFFCMANVGIERMGDGENSVNVKCESLSIHSKGMVGGKGKGASFISCDGAF